jgi:hypothetical protein
VKKLYSLGLGNDFDLWLKPKLQARREQARADYHYELQKLYPNESIDDILAKLDGDQDVNDKLNTVKSGFNRVATTTNTSTTMLAAVPTAITSLSDILAESDDDLA